ncbi:MAG: GTP 3',8-cyclase MoaA [Bacteroidia bacterium]|nr:GTP 3',8-cyclase MoaA [Bacteroidia bacterium]
MLRDRYHRLHNYLRISLTDKCNFKCSYCMPVSQHSCLQQRQLMSADEIEKIAAEFVSLGINKIRLTGGEPLVRNDFGDIAFRLAKLPVERVLTTNGSLLHRHIETLVNARFSSVNVSLDSLNPHAFASITQVNHFHRVWKNILLLLEHRIRVKINVVAINGFIQQEILRFIELTGNLPLHIRFIEFMPFKGNGWNSEKVITASELFRIVCNEYDVVKLKDEPHSTARKYKVIGYEGTFAFITTMSRQFCGECNRIRLTADGKIKNCLFGKEELDLLAALRTGMPLEPVIRQSLLLKHQTMGGQFTHGYRNTEAHKIFNRSMVNIGG